MSEDKAEKKVSRRDYIKYAGLGVAALAVGGVAGAYLTQAPTPPGQVTQTVTQTMAPVTSVVPTTVPTTLMPTAIPIDERYRGKFKGVTLNVLYTDTAGGAAGPMSLIGAAEDAYGCTIQFDSLPWSPEMDKVASELGSASPYYAMMCFPCNLTTDQSQHIEPMDKYLLDPNVADPDLLQLDKVIPRAWLDTVVWDTRNPPYSLCRPAPFENERPIPFMDENHLDQIRNEGWTITGLPMHDNSGTYQFWMKHLQNESLKQKFRTTYGYDWSIGYIDEYQCPGLFLDGKLFSLYRKDGTRGTAEDFAEFFTQRHNPDSPTKGGAMYASFEPFAMQTFFKEIWTTRIDAGLPMPANIWLDENYKPAFNDPEYGAAEAVDTWVRWTKEYLPVSGGSYSFEDVTTAMVAESCEMANQQHLMVLPGESAFSPGPGREAADGTVHAWSSNGAWYNVINKHASEEEKLCAYKVMEFWFSRAAQLSYSKYYYHYTRDDIYTEVINDKQLQAQYPEIRPDFYRCMRAGLATGLTWPRIAGNLEIVEDGGHMLFMVLKGNMTAQKALDWWADRVTKTMTKWGFKF